MAIISVVGRKNRSVKMLIASMYGILTVGGITIMIPLMIMLTLSVSSVVDLKEFALVPRYFFSEGDLFRKYLAEKYGEKLALVRQNYPVEGQGWLNWPKVRPVLHDGAGDSDSQEKLANDWSAFLGALPSPLYVPAYTNEPNHGLAQFGFQKYLKDRYHDADNFNAKARMNVTYLSTVNFPADNAVSQVWFYDETPIMKDYFEFKATLEPEFRLATGINEIWDAWLKFKYNDKLDDLNKAWKANYQDAFFTDIAFPLEAPTAGAQAKDYQEFLHVRYPRHWLTVKGGSSAAYQAFLKARYKSVGDFNIAAGSAYKSWSEVAFTETAPQRAEMKLWSDYANTLPLSSWQLDNVESRFRDALVKKYGSLAEAEKAYAVTLQSVDKKGVILPRQHADEYYFLNHKTGILWHFMSHNYVAVSRFFFQQGKSMTNTLILVVLSIITALVVNPIAAFALSRFRLSYTPKVLLFLLATAAFPAEVTAIPQFLLIKKLNMLNTFWALVLPGLVNGFWIFMLKGFFDSLPKELYEAAILEGAGEFTLFTRITVPLAAPILALTAFGAFNAAYGGYLWNIIVANDTKMWTLMVSLQQYMNGTPANLVMAAMVIASIPTLIAFLMAQQAIIKGIVIPSMH
jgi:ABC-type glycerol-3-phosphate transport system permease component